MYTFFTFVILTIIEVIFIWLQWSKANDYKEVGRAVADVSTLSKNSIYNSAVTFLVKLLKVAKPVLYLIGIVILIINLVLSLIIGGVLGLLF